MDHGVVSWPCRFARRRCKLSIWHRFDVLPVLWVGCAVVVHCVEQGQAHAAMGRMGSRVLIVAACGGACSLLSVVFEKFGSSCSPGLCLSACTATNGHVPQPSARVRGRGMLDGVEVGDQ